MDHQILSFRSDKDRTVVLFICPVGPLVQEVNNRPKLYLLFRSNLTLSVILFISYLHNLHNIVILCNI